MQLLLARWEFATVTVFHFFFVPLTIGLGFVVAVMQTLAYRRHDASWDRLSRYFGRLFLIEIAVGVVTGIVLEFQFGLNWSAYSVFVGNIFGAPLAIEALLAFFMESTFIGLWIFGRDRLPTASPGNHLDGKPRDYPLCLFHIGRQFVDAAPGRLQGCRRPSRADQLLGSPWQPDALGLFYAYRFRRIRDGGCPGARDKHLAGHARRRQQ